MERGKKLIVVLTISIIISTSPTLARSLYVITDCAGPSDSTITAYDINGDQIHYQATVDITTLNPGNGAVGNSIWSEKEIMFVTYENSPTVAWSSTKTLEFVGRNNTGVSSLAGVVVDTEKEKIYIMKRADSDLLIYTYNQSSNTSTFLQHEAS